MKIAVTGCGGQLGSELCRTLGEAALPLDLPEFDLTDRDNVRSVLLAAGPTAVINTAAYTQVDRAEHDAERCWKINSEGVGYLAEVCRELDCPLLQISTDYVFGLDTARSTPYREDDEPGPQGVYAQTKRSGERQAAAWERHLIVRTCGLYGKPGPKTPGGNFVDTMLRLGRERGHLRVVDDQHCAPSFVPHVARALLFLLNRAARGTFHVVNTGATTWHGFAAEIFRQAGMQVTLERITTAQYGAASPRPAYSLLDTSKYHALGGPPMPSWPQALAEYLGNVR
ncbi:MAG TPA: dTDP-4-dehydrorhamnose reductase [Pirellulales bacterium]|nr:dTDP-4-dehydrorhamnose reductase [Pirellulales bacterium]